MSIEIKPISFVDELRMVRGVEGLKSPELSHEKKSASFGDFLEKKFDELNQAGLEVDQKIQNSIEGKSENPHETIIAIQKADVQFRLMLSMKEQLEQAYQQIMRTSIG